MDKVDTHLSVEKRMLQTADQGQGTPVKALEKNYEDQTKEEEKLQESGGKRNSSILVKSILKNKWVFKGWKKNYKYHQLRNWLY